MPGLIAMIMTLIGALLTALVIAREWERGTMEALMVTPVTHARDPARQARPLFHPRHGRHGCFGGAGGAGCSSVPLRGSLLVLLVASALFMLAALGMGLLISIVARNQFVAGQIAIIVTFLPAFILSGFIFDIGCMPAAVQIITHIVAGALFRRHPAERCSWPATSGR